MKELVVILNYTGHVEHHGCRLVSSNLTAVLKAAFHQVHLVEIGRDWQSSKKEIRSASLVLINGEGTMHHSSPFALRLLKAARYCQKWQVPVFLVNSVWQDNSLRFDRMSKSIDRIFVRETRSLRSLNTSNSMGAMVPDLTLSTDLSLAQSSRTRVLVSDSVDRLTTKILYSVHKGEPDSKFISLRPASEDPSTRVAGEQVTFPKVNLISRFRSFSIRAFLDSMREKLLQKFDVRFQLANDSLENLGFSELIQNLREARLVITGRFHLVCFCILTGTPFIATASNSHKIQGLLEDANLAHRFVEPAMLPSALEQGLKWSHSDTQNCLEYLNLARVSTEEMFKTIFLWTNPREASPKSSD